MKAETPVWKRPDGSLVDCTDKVKLLEENYLELQQVMQDMFEDAILMGVDEQGMRSIIQEMVEKLRSPKG
ncbi:hypothetical protein [Entomobacter blattae]|uniref:Uncharacterized protein n=1 Tax=Entomobacter blattae TaxID=2762277 RepID=A0A7H1NQ71_9PROT|nr:hypothetical protein [Entomobacter blattae]QNT77931.1 hypothetical protein JGUZn3_06890 [Entomobacter blattae]